MTRDEARQSLAVGIGLLFVARTLSFGLTLVAPIIIVRAFSVDEYGLYKQALLLHASLASILTLGLPASLFYFVPRQRESTDAYVTQTLVTLGSVGVAAALALVLLRRAVADFLNSPGLTPYIGMVAVIVVLSLLTTMLEPLMIIKGAVRDAALTGLVCDCLRATLVIVAALWTREIGWVLAGLVLWGAVRLAVLVVYLRRSREMTWRIEGHRLGEQFRHALPFALAIFMVTAADSVHQYAVSYFYTPAVFALYSVGYMQVSLVWIAFESVADVTLVRLTELRSRGSFEEARLLLHEAVTKLSLLFFPLYAWLMIAASDVIVLLYTDRFQDSVAILRIFLTTVLLAAVGLDYVPRAFGETGFILRSNIVRLLVTAVLLGMLMPFLGAMGAAVAMVAALAVTKAIMVRKVAALCGASILTILPWSQLLKIFLIALAAGLPAFVVHETVGLGLVQRVIAGGVVFAAAYGGMVWAAGLISSTDRRRIALLAREAWRLTGAPDVLRAMSR